MKKKYSKPGIIIEDFKLVESIASYCEGVKPGGTGSTQGKGNYADKSSCGWDFGNMTIWISGVEGCKIEQPDIPYNGMCYNNPNGGNSIFGSV